MAPRYVRHVHNDGGRAAAGFSRASGDCVCRAISIASGKSYREVRDGLNALCALLHAGRCAWLPMPRKCPSALTGVPELATYLYLGQLGWAWTLVDRRLRYYELPPGRLVVAVPRHLVAVIDHVVHDSGDSWRGLRRVEGYWQEGHHGNSEMAACGN